MKRRFSTRDLGLSIRMGLALAVVGVLYLALDLFQLRHLGGGCLRC